MLASRLEEPRHIEVGSHPDPRGCVVHADVGKEKEHEQRSPAGDEVESHGPVGGVEPGISVPPCIARILGAGKSNRERSEARSWSPAAGTNQLVKRRMQPWRVRRVPERLF